MLFGKPHSTAEKMRALGEAYAASLPGKLHELETLARPLSSGGPFEELAQSLEAVRILAHKIAGTAGTFGYQSITDHARAIEKSLKLVIEAEQPFTAEQAAAIELQIEALKKLGAAKTARGAHADAPCETTVANAQPAEFVVLLAPSGGATELLVREIEDSGYGVQWISGHVEKVDGVVQGRARAILVHAALPDGFKICRELNEIFRKEFRTSVPIIFLSDTDDFRMRLQAVRSGAKAFIVAPLEARTIVRKIEELSHSMVFAPHRVLIVEDDDMLALQCGSAFDGPGYATRVIKEPTELLDRLQTFDTDLIVMDLSVAGASGLDLAKVVWQHDDFRDVAILFLTPGIEFNAQLLQLGLSDEFFFPRPIDIHALRTGAARYLMDLRCGRRAPNCNDLLAHLDRIGGLQTSKDRVGGKADDRRSEPSDSDVALETLAKVLVVDDDRHLVDAIAIKLSEHGIEVLKAFSGEQGFRVAWEERPDVIVTDYDMPDGAGDYLLGRLKDAEETRDIPVMVLTAHTLDGRKDYALEREFVGRLGAVSYLAKPISLDALVAEVGRVVPLPSSGSP
jgi:DNA-binding response OmpR family regulator/HPt (histidine-containing phosphotransfer) domain-containing protein